jgi:hypothetical protein
MRQDRDLPAWKSKVTREDRDLPAWKSKVTREDRDLPEWKSTSQPGAMDARKIAIPPGPRDPGYRAPPLLH